MVQVRCAALPCPAVCAQTPEQPPYLLPLRQCADCPVCCVRCRPPRACGCRQRLVWDDPAVVNDLLKKGLFMRIYEPQVS